MSEAFLDHGTPEITEKQFEAINKYAPNHGTNISSVAKSHPLNVFPPFYKDRQGKIYSYHFWLYPLLVAPFLSLVKIAGYSMPWAFIWFNMVMALVASWAIYSCAVIPRVPRLLILSLFWSCGTIPYLRWTHPEVFTAALLALALTNYSGKRYAGAALFSAIAAQQNPPAIFLTAIFLIFDFIKHCCRKKSMAFPSYARVLCWSGCILVSLVSTIFFWAHFGVYNLIAHAGMSKFELISLGRLFSFYFDINQGMIILLWPFMALAPVLLAMNIWHSGFRRKADLANFFFLLFLSILLAVPALSTTNWNSGGSYVMRYAYWASVPALFSSAYLFFEKKYIDKIYMAVVCAFLAQNWVYSRYPERYDYLVYNPWARFVLNHAPGLYNPAPEIFIERGRHEEGWNNSGIYMYSDRGEIRKILLNTSVNNISRVLCSDGQAAMKYVRSSVRAEAAWSYYNLGTGCRSGWGSGFSRYSMPDLMPSLIGFGSTDSKFYTGGWSPAESNHRWSTGQDSNIVFALKEIPKNGLGVMIEGAPLGRQRAKVSINGHAIFNGRIPENGFPYLIIDGAWLNRATNILSFHFPDAHPPGNGDMRALAFAVTSIHLYVLKN